MNGHTFDPTIGAQWLTLADRLQLERDLADLPTLADILERNYAALLARGDHDPDDRSVRYPTRMAVLDLADRRTKWERSADRTEPLTLADRGVRGPEVDPQWWSTMARNIGARRQGILPTLGSWVSLAVGEMHDADEWHTVPADPDRVVWVVTPCGSASPTKPGPTVASEAGWLLLHLNWICDQQWVLELAAEVRDIVRDLEQLGVDLRGPDHKATGTARELADDLDIPIGTMRRWIACGWLTPINRSRPAIFVRRDVVQLRHS